MSISTQAEMQIQAYPNFRPLQLQDVDIFNQAFSNNPSNISEFTFTNLYAWRQIYKFEVSHFNNFIILRSDHNGQKSFLPPIGEGNIKSVVASILKDENGIFVRVPEDIKTLLDRESRIKIELDRDNADYLYKTLDLIELSGAKYDGKRNLIKKFKSEYNFEYVKFTAANIKECLKFEETWCTIKDCDSVEGLRDERLALREMVENFSLFGLIAGAIKVEGKICAVAIAEKLNPDTLVMHILKADPNIPGLYQLINNEFLKREGSSFKYVNLEQDLGIEGLRKAKFSYHPIELIKKYKVSLLK